jgi:ketosteroid isomerase-like protein
MKTYLAPLAGKISVARYDMIGPQVQHHGDVAILSFNLVSYIKPPGAAQERAVRWNSTEVYALLEGQWKIVHSHWSYVKPELKEPIVE